MFLNGEQVCNPGLEFRSYAQTQAEKIAINSPKGELSFRQFESLSDDYAYTMQRAGIKAGHKVVLMIKPSLDLYVHAFALFKLGAIPVVVDPGMGLKRMLRNYRSVNPEAFVGIAPAHLIRVLARKSFETIKVKLWVKDGTVSFAGDKGRSHVPGTPFPIALTQKNDLAIINFTTGSTGPAKAVEMTYGMVMATVELFRASFAQTDADIDMVTFPFFGIVSLLLGSRVIIPPMNPAKPAEVDPQKIIDTINFFGVTVMVASPALLNRVGEYAIEKGLKLPSLRIINSGGAPITMANLQRISGLLGPEGTVYSSWGATEGLPLATISGSDILGRYQSLIHAGQGTPIGRILAGIEMRIIESTNDVIPQWDDSLIVPAGKIGEIVVSGPNVSRSYHGDATANAAHKIWDHANGVEKFWHRTGDLAWADPEGVLFFCGRKAHCIIDENGSTLHSVSAEGVTNAHPLVHRSALVGAGPRPVMGIELIKGVTPSDQPRIADELVALMAKSPASASVSTVVFHRRFPVDPRHNAKIERPLLGVWAAHQLGRSDRDGLLLKIIPILGWIYIVAGLFIKLPAGFWMTLWWIDLFLSTVVHIAQIPEGIRVGAIHGYTASESAVRTFILGATWWKPLRPIPQK